MSDYYRINKLIFIKPHLPGLGGPKQVAYGRVRRKIGRKSRKLNSPALIEKNT